MQRTVIPKRNRPSVNIVQEALRMVLTQMITEICKDFVTLTYSQIPINLQLALLPMPTHTAGNSYYPPPPANPLIRFPRITTMAFLDNQYKNTLLIDRYYDLVTMKPKPTVTQPQVALLPTAWRRRPPTHKVGRKPYLTLRDSSTTWYLSLWAQINVQDWSLQCPSNVIRPFQIYLSQKSHSRMQPQLEKEDITWNSQYNLPTTRTNKRRGIIFTRSGVRWLILNTSHHAGNMFHIIHAQA